MKKRFLLDVGKICTYRIDMPKEFVGRDDVDVYIEFGTLYGKEERIAYNLWFQIKGGKTRTCLHTDDFIGNMEDENRILQKIVNEINSNFEIQYAILQWAKKYTE